MAGQVMGYSMPSVRFLPTEEQRIIWRRALPEQVVREMTSELMRGRKGQDLEDAHAEFLHRGYDKDESLSPSRRKAKKNSNSRYA